MTDHFILAVTIWTQSVTSRELWILPTHWPHHKLLIHQSRQPGPGHERAVTLADFQLWWDLVMFYFCMSHKPLSISQCPNIQFMWMDWLDTNQSYLTHIPLFHSLHLKCIFTFIGLSTYIQVLRYLSSSVTWTPGTQVSIFLIHLTSRYSGIFHPQSHNLQVLKYLSFFVTLPPGAKEPVILSYLTSR